ncbi:cell division protein ZipA C-terminal FtsZ-binding domain-containing protein [Noviherbaspirillum agri]
MTELQASLMIIGATIVVGVISYNKWQEFKAKKSVQKAFSSEHDDVLMQPDADAASEPEQRREPVLDTADTGDQGIVDSQSSNADEEVLAKPPKKELPIDELLDCAIPLALESPVRGEKLLPKLQALRHVGNKPVHFVGLCNDGEWEAVAHGGQYFRLVAGIQLANRSTALNELEYSELIMRLRQICDEIDAEPDVPDMTEVMANARALHQFVAEYDAQLSVNVHSKGQAWAINTLLAALERQGFDLRPDGRLVMPDGEGGVLFSLSTNVTLAAETTSRLTLLLDVPRVARDRDGFGAMTACAKMLAARLDGVVVDDGNQPLSEGTLAEIAGQVSAFYDQMESANIPAGSVRAQRLFS